MEGSFALNPMVNTHKYKLLGEVNTGSIFLSVFEQAFSIDPSTTELGGKGEGEGEEKEGNEGDESGESKLLEVGRSTDTKSEHPSAFTMLGEVECKQWEEVRWKIHLSVSVVDMSE